MRVLLVHNRYQQRGGEDAVFEAERDLLIARDANVETMEFSNHEIPASPGPVDSARLAANTVWSRSSAQRVQNKACEHGADVVHFHNTFPLVSPAAYKAARKTGAAVVQTLHNYRLLCPSALMFREGKPCEDCLGRKFAFPGIRHACYRASRAQTAAVVAMQSVHRGFGTWRRQVDRYIALTEFGRSKFVQGGLPAERIEVKPNFIPLDNAPDPLERNGILFVGRLDGPKGVPVLLDAWATLPGVHELRIVGDGELDSVVRAAAQRCSSILPLGRLQRPGVLREMAGARALVFPSVWYEGFAVTVVEAFATGTPVIASRLGAMSELIEDGRTGLLFNPGDAEELACKIAWAEAHPAEMAAMGRAARAVYQAKYTPDQNYEQLMTIYDNAITRRQEAR